MKHTTQSPAKPTPPPQNNQCEEPQEQTSENEEPLNNKHIQNKIEDLQRKIRRTQPKKEKELNQHAKL